MDRFAQSSFIKNIGVHRKLDDTVCRCCGVSYDETYPIIDQVAYDGIEFKEKLEKLTGKQFYTYFATLVLLNSKFVQCKQT